MNIGLKPPYRIEASREGCWTIYSDTTPEPIAKWMAANPGKRCPWEHNNSVCDIHILFNGSGPSHGPRVVFTPAEAHATAEFIVRACNSYADMLEALEMVRDADNDCRSDGLQTIPPMARAKIDRAIAKATQP